MGRGGNKNIIFNIHIRIRIHIRMTIYTIGDSHSVSGWTNTTQITLGPLLCYSFGKEKLNRFDIKI